MRRRTITIHSGGVCNGLEMARGSNVVCVWKGGGHIWYVEVCVCKCAACFCEKDGCFCACVVCERVDSYIRVCVSARGHTRRAYFRLLCLHACLRASAFGAECFKSCGAEIDRNMRGM